MRLLLIGGAGVLAWFMYQAGAFTSLFNNLIIHFVGFGKKWNADASGFTVPIVLDFENKVNRTLTVDNISIILNYEGSQLLQGNTSNSQFIIKAAVTTVVPIDFKLPWNITPVSFIKDWLKGSLQTVTGTVYVRVHGNQYKVRVNIDPTQFLPAPSSVLSFLPKI